MPPTPEFMIKRILPDSSTSQMRQVFSYVSLLRLYGERINLVSQADLSHLWENHIYPSVIALRLLEIPQQARLIDVGSGGGLPAIPLKIMRPDLDIVLVESSRKKSAFLKKVIQEIDLPGIQVLNTRLFPEDQKFPHQNTFEVMTVRALASLEELIPMAQMLLKPTGFLLAWKGDTDLLEMKSAASHGTFDYLEYQVPVEFYPISEKFSSLRLLKIWFEKRRE